MNTKFVGILPAAGMGSRLRPFRYPKELLPITYEALHQPFRGIRPRVVSEFALETFKLAGVDNCYVIIAPWKLEMINYFGDGSTFDVSLSYLYQEEAGGLPPAIDIAYPWVRDANVVFAMPDTIVRPRECVRDIKTMMLQSNADVVLGVFPTKEAKRLGPVIIGGDTAVKVYDKCDSPPADNTWGVAAWGPRFTELLHDGLRKFRQSGSQSSEPVLGHFFEQAIQERMRVRAIEFPGGSFSDIGTPSGIRSCLELHSRIKDEEEGTGEAAL